MEYYTDENIYTEKDRAGTRRLLAVVFAFIIGLTVGSIDRDNLSDLKDKYFSSADHALISRDSTTSEVQLTDTEASVTTPLAKATTEPDKNFFTVYRTPTGKKYHFSPLCAGDNRIATDLDGAVSLGLTPCKKCADG